MYAYYVRIVSCSFEREWLEQCAKLKVKPLSDLTHVDIHVGEYFDVSDFDGFCEFLVELLAHPVSPGKLYRGPVGWIRKMAGLLRKIGGSREQGIE